MEPSTERAMLPNTALSFTLTNETGMTFTTNYYGWSAWKMVDGEWFRVALRIVLEPAMMLDSGDLHAWNLNRR